jgi:hypothetical protein
MGRGVAGARGWLHTNNVSRKSRKLREKRDESPGIFVAWAFFGGQKKAGSPLLFCSQPFLRDIVTIVSVWLATKL